MTPRPTGRREVRDGMAYLVLTRTFRAPIEDVWAAMTEPERLQRWIGTWTGDPDTGEVTFRMTAEGEDAPPEIYRIEVCEPPNRLRTRSWSDGSEQEAWVLDLQLAHESGRTTLTFAQAMAEPETAAHVGPGWDYYLDRLVAAETGADVEAIHFEPDYYPAMSEHYRGLFA